MGIVNPALDPYNLNNDYGVQANNRKHIFNARLLHRTGQSRQTQQAGWKVSSTDGNCPESLNCRVGRTSPRSASGKKTSG